MFGTIWVKGGGSLDLLIKCAGAAGARPAYGFTVRAHHRPVYAASALATTENAAGEALSAALVWLRAQSVTPGAVTIRTTATDLPGEQLAEVAANGWTVCVHRVAPEWVSEAEALARRTVLGVTVRRPVARRPGSSRRPPTKPESGLIVICDGGYKPLSRAAGLAAYGFVAWKNHRLLHREKGVVCHGPAAGSQMAELGAVVAALRWVAASPHLHKLPVELRNDCQGVVYSLAGRQRMRLRRGAVMLGRTASRLLERLHHKGCQVHLRHIPRRLAEEADALCRRVYARLPADRHTVCAFLKQRVSSPAANGHPES